MRYSELIIDSDFKLIVDFLSKKWNGRFDNVISIEIGDKKIKIDSLKTALQSYYWPYKIKRELPDGFDYCGSSYESSKKILRLAAEMLHTNSENIEGAKIVLEWGGVVNKNMARINNWTVTDFKNEVKKAQQNWEGFCMDDLDLRSGVIDFHINSGFSKIYSLSLNDFIIYDSRTAAALTTFIFEVLGKTPDDWTLKVPSPKVSKERRILAQFGKVNTIKQYWTSNVIASVLVKEVCKKINFKSTGCYNVSIRDVEAALFMLGADISKMKGIYSKK